MKLSENQLNVLRYVANGYQRFYGCRGGARTGYAHAARNRTIKSLEDLGFVRGEGIIGLRITDAGATCIVERGFYTEAKPK